jgi:hypothetical protein
MMRFIRPRLRMPVRLAALGAVAAAAFAAGPGPRTLGIAFAIITAGIAVGCAIAAYVRGREDSDLGAIYGSRADERQKLISLQARGLAGRGRHGRRLRRFRNHLRDPRRCMAVRVPLRARRTRTDPCLPRRTICCSRLPS